MPATIPNEIMLKDATPEQIEKNIQDQITRQEVELAALTEAHSTKVQEYSAIAAEYEEAETMEELEAKKELATKIVAEGKMLEAQINSLQEVIETCREELA